jgi:hypothetical protein
MTGLPRSQTTKPACSLSAILKRSIKPSPTASRALGARLEQEVGRKPLADITALLIQQTLDRHLTVTTANDYQ